MRPKKIFILDSVLLEGGDLYKAGNESMQILSSGPNEANKFEIKLGYLKMIQKAQKYIYIQSPYLILDNSISDALKLAALSGVDVKIMIPGKASSFCILGKFILCWRAY